MNKYVITPINDLGWHGRKKENPIVLLADRIQEIIQREKLPLIIEWSTLVLSPTSKELLTKR